MDSLNVPGSELERSSMNIKNAFPEFDALTYDQRFDKSGTGTVYTMCRIKDADGYEVARFRIFDFSEMRKSHHVRRYKKLLDEFSEYRWEVGHCRFDGNFEKYYATVMVITNPWLFLDPIIGRAGESSLRQRLNLGPRFMQILASKRRGVPSQAD